MALSEAEKEAGYKAVPTPSPNEVAILRRVAAGYLLVTRNEKGCQYSYDGGAPILIERTERGQKRRIPMDTKAFERFRRNQWILPIDGESLLDDPLDAQRWRARNAADPPLPRITGGQRHPA